MEWNSKRRQWALELRGLCDCEQLELEPPCSLTVKSMSKSVSTRVRASLRNVYVTCYVPQALRWPSFVFAALQYPPHRQYHPIKLSDFYHDRDLISRQMTSRVEHGFHESFSQ